MQRPIALESYLEDVKTQFAQVEMREPKMPYPATNARCYPRLNKQLLSELKKADKGTTTVIMNKSDKIEGQTQLDVSR